MKIIVAVDKNYGIGLDNSLLFHVSEDMKNFKNLTSNNVVVYGRKTLESFPNARPLPNRQNIVLSRTNGNTEEVQYVDSIEELLKIVKELEINGKEVFVIGGEQVYNQLIDYCDVAYVTKFFDEKKANKYFPNLEKSNNWGIRKVLEKGSGIDKISGKEVQYAIVQYKNFSPKLY